jgi:hypothetical protein
MRAVSTVSESDNRRAKESDACSRGRRRCPRRTVGGQRARGCCSGMSDRKMTCSMVSRTSSMALLGSTLDGVGSLVLPLPSSKVSLRNEALVRNFSESRYSPLITAENR